MTRRAETLRDLAKVRAEHRDRLNAVVGNQGTALGRKNYDGRGEPIGDPCIIIYMPHKIHNALLAENVKVPPTLLSKDGEIEAPTDVVVTTTPIAPKDTPELDADNKELIGTLQWFDGKLDHIPAGAQIGFGDWEDDDIEEFVGTIGYIVRSTKPGEEDKIGLLTNEHVGVRSGHSLYIRATSNNRCASVSRIASWSTFPTTNGSRASTKSMPSCEPTRRSSRSRGRYTAFFATRGPFPVVRLVSR